MRRMKQGVPHGGVLSPPILFNIYMSSMPLPSAENIKTTPYADQMTFLSPPLVRKILNLN